MKGKALSRIRSFSHLQHQHHTKNNLAGSSEQQKQDRDNERDRDRDKDRERDIDKDRDEEVRERTEGGSEGEDGDVGDLVRDRMGPKENTGAEDGEMEGERQGEGAEDGRVGGQERVGAEEEYRKGGGGGRGGDIECSQWAASQIIEVSSKHNITLHIT